MAKYDQVLTNLKTNLPAAQNILIVLPQAEVDHLASGLALLLSLEAAGKKVTIVTDSTIRVGHTHLFAIDQVKNTIPEAGSGDFILALGGVVQYDSSGKATVPSLQELTWHPNGGDLDLVFKVTPGQKFAPTHITPKPQTGGYNLIFIIGAQSLPGLGNIYNQNTQVFNGPFIVNIDNSSANTQFGGLNIVDPQASSISEMVGQVIPGLGLSYQGDIASNILTGIYTATSNLQIPEVGADTFETISFSIKAGGQKPVVQAPVEQPAVVPAQPSFESMFSSSPPPVNSSGALPWIPAGNSGFKQAADNFTVPSVVNSNSEPLPSPEEVPGGERVVTDSPEPDWLTPKIFKGGNLN